jgi:hypothetical protein
VTVVRVLVLAGLAVLALLGVGTAEAADPGLFYPFVSEASDQRTGSVLFFNYYASSTDSPASDDTDVSLTNTSTTSAAFIRLLFVNGDTGGVAASTICLTATQTARFALSELRPGESGFLIAVSINGVNGCPSSFNHLVGRADVRLASGFRGSLEAVSVPAVSNSFQMFGCDSDSAQVDLAFSGLEDEYARLPRTLELSSVPARADARTLLVVNRIGGSGVSLAGVGSASGVLYDDAQNAFPFSFTHGAPQFRSELSNAFPATSTPFETVIPGGRTGWLALFNASSDFAYLGAALTLAQTSGAKPVAALRTGRDQAAPPSPAITGAVNLRAPTITNGAVTLPGLPVFPPSC